MRNVMIIGILLHSTSLIAANTSIITSRFPMHFQQQNTIDYNRMLSANMAPVSWSQQSLTPSDSHLTLQPLDGTNYRRERAHNESSLSLFNYRFGLRYGTPSEKQILPIHTKELYLQYCLNAIHETTAIEASITQLTVADRMGYAWGIGPALSLPIPAISQTINLTAQGKINYLTKHHFGRKRYGGPIQWSYAFGLRGGITKQASLSYIWRHMSNGGRYEHNPTLNTHVISLGAQF